MGVISPRFQLREVKVPLLPPNSESIRILHFSDLHLTPNRKRELSWIKSLNQLDPDLVISTGDHIAHPNAIKPLVDALGDLLLKPGAYVFGSNDYFAPSFKNPLRYLKSDDGRRTHGLELPWKSLDSELSKFGWKNLNNDQTFLSIKHHEIEFRGTDDAHLEYDQYEKVAGTKSKNLYFGVTHAPYKRVLEAMQKDGADLIFAGHTHGGQIRLPWYPESKALVTNCDLPTWRARGLTYENNWLHVSAGMGTSPFAPLRFACAPEATLLHVVSG